MTMKRLLILATLLASFSIAEAQSPLMMLLVMGKKKAVVHDTTGKDLTHYAHNYYVAPWGNDANSGHRTDSALQHLHVVGGKTLVAGDSVLLRAGQTFRDSTTMPNSGSAGNVITLASYGSGASPVINGSDLVTAWVDNAANQSNTWRDTLATQPLQVFFNGTRGTLVASVAACNGAMKWYWASGILYAYGTVSPSATYASPGVEASVRAWLFNGAAKDYVTISGVDFTKANEYNIRAIGTHLTVSNDTISYGYSDGIFATGSDINITGSRSHHNIGTGIKGYQGSATPGHQNYVQNCLVDSNKYHGIAFTDSCWTVQYNNVGDNGDTTNLCIGIETWDATNHKWASSDTIRYNTVWGTASNQNDGAGINLDEGSARCAVYGNITYGNDASGVATNSAVNCSVYNNVAFHNNRNSSGQLTWAAKGEFYFQGDLSSGVVVKNNIGYSVRDGDFAVTVTPHVDTSAGFSMTNNLWYAPVATNWFYKAGVQGSALSVFNGDAKIGTDFYGDPKFTDTSAAVLDFRLLTTSPAIDEGAATSFIVDRVGTAIPLPAGGVPDIGAFEFSQSSGNIITVSAGANGTIFPGTSLVGTGRNKKFAIAGNSGYVLDVLTIDGTPNADSTGGSFTFNNVTTTHTIAATFKVGPYLIDVTAGAHGIIWPVDTSVASGQSLTVNFLGDATYLPDIILIDGVQANDSVRAYGHYTFSNVTATHTVTCSYAASLIDYTPTAVLNGGFETSGSPFGSWNTYTDGATITRDATPHSGSYACKIVNASAGGYIYTGNITTAGFYHFFSFWAKSSTGTPSVIVTDYAAIPITTTWTQYYAKYIAAAAYFQIFCTDVATVYIDDVRLIKSAE